MPPPTNTPLLCLAVFGDGSNNPSTNRRRFSLRSRPDPADAGFQNQNAVEPPQLTTPFAGQPIGPESSHTAVSNGVNPPVKIQGDGVPYTLQHIPLSGIGAVVGATPGVTGSTPTQANVKSLKSIRDDLNTLLQETSPAETHRLRKIIDELNAGIPVERITGAPPSVNNGLVTNVSPVPRPALGSEGGIDTTKAYLRHARTFQSSNTPGETVWYESSDGVPLAHPDTTICPNIGDLYLHHDRTTGNLQLWISTIPGHWESVPVGYVQKYLPDRIVMDVSHPKFSDRLLKLRANGEPSWVTRQTLATLKSRKKGATVQS